MTEGIIVALISFAGAAVGTGGGIIVSSKLTNYRIRQLELKVDKHNCLIDRMYKAEKVLEVQDEKIKVVNRRISDLEKAKEGKED